MSRRPQRGRAAPPRGGSLHTELAQFDALFAAGRLDKAAALLVDIQRRFSDHPEVLGRAMNLAVAADDPLAILAAAAPLNRQRPGEPEVALNLAIARFRMRYLALAQRSFAAFATRWPQHPQAAHARQEADTLAPVVTELWSHHALAGPPDQNALVQHEEIQELLTLGQWQQAIRIGEQLLRAHPEFIATRNNLSLAYQNLGRLDQAIAAARQVLADDPQNYQALGNLTRFLVLAGQLDEAAEAGARLRAIPADHPEIAAKQAEALSFLGDDAGVLAVFEQVQRRKDRDDDPGISAMLHHLAAVAALREGNTQAARRRWQRALELSPALTLAADNLADLDLPVDERHGPWPYTIEYWVTRSTIEELIQAVSGSGKRGDEAARRIARQHLQRHPELLGIAPLLLDRGDPVGRELVIQLAGMSRAPELLEALAAFAEGKRGPTSLRMQAAQLAKEGGTISGETMRFWQGGEQHETIVLGWELHGEPSGPELPPEVERLQHEAGMAIHRGNFKQGERLLLKALELMPDEPTLLNNLAAAYGPQGRDAEAEAIARRLVAEHPDYLFGRTNLVPYLIQAGQVDEAEALIRPLLQRQRLHFGEFGALAGAQIAVDIAQGKLDGAESWIKMWEQAIPDHPHLQIYRARLREARRQARRKR